MTPAIRAKAEQLFGKPTETTTQREPLPDAVLASRKVSAAILATRRADVRRQLEVQAKQMGPK